MENVADDEIWRQRSSITGDTYIDCAIQLDKNNSQLDAFSLHNEHLGQLLGT